MLKRSGEMNLRGNVLTEQHAKEISTWHYEGKYALYDLPSWEEMQQQDYALCAPKKRQRFMAYVNDQDELIGFVNLLDEGDFVFFGIGIHPNYCNQGIGKKVTALALKESRKRYPNKPLLLEVRTWNQRAVSCYVSQGFEIIETKIQTTYLGEGESYVMKYNQNGGE